MPASSAGEQAFLDRLVEWAGGEEAIRVVLLLGSRGSERGALDELSDFDLLLYLEDRQTPLDRDAWPEWWGPVLLRHREKGTSEGHPFAADLVLYRDGTKIDHTIAPVAALRRIVRRGRLPPPLEAGFRIVLDKDGLAASLPEPGGDAYVPEPPDRKAYEAVVEEFLWESFYVARNLVRGELLPAKYSLDHVMKLRLLRRMLEWQAGARSDWSAPVGAWGRGLRARLDPDLWTEVARTWVGPEPEENWDALFATLSVFARVARAVGGTLGHGYPDTLHRDVIERLERLRRRQACSD